MYALILTTMSTENPSPHRDDASYELAKHYLSLTLVVACPVLILLPPRKLDKYTLFLGTATLCSASQLEYERSGRSGFARLRSGLNPFNHFNFTSPTSQAAQVKAKLKQEKVERLKREGKLIQARTEEEKTTPLEKIWMGGEKEGWKEKRLKEEQEAIDKGKGYGSLILDQLYEVVAWKPRQEEEEEEGKKTGR